MAKKYRSKTGDFPSSQMLHEIEESCLYLIELGRSFNLDMKKILNHTAKDGNTLFSEASIFSERLTEYLLGEKVKINSVDDSFMTPSFRVRLKTVIFSK